MDFFYLLSCILFVVLHGIFAASEISFISSRIHKLRYQVNQGDKNAKKVYELILKPERFLATILVGMNIALVLSSSLLTLFLIRVGVKDSFVWITFIFTPFMVIFAELIPKNIGRFLREDFSCNVVKIIIFFEKIFLPIVESIEIISKYLVKIFIRKPKKKSLFVTKDEIKLLINQIEKEGGMDRGEKEAIEEVFEFKRDKIRDICVQRKNISAFDYTDSRETILKDLSKRKFTRYPIFKDRRIVGYINIYDLFYNPKENWQSVIRPIAKVGFNQNIQEVFTRLKNEKENLALVIKGNKEYGIITIQDIIREIITVIVKI